MMIVGVIFVLIFIISENWGQNHLIILVTYLATLSLRF